MNTKKSAVALAIVLGCLFASSSYAENIINFYARNHTKTLIDFHCNKEPGISFEVKLKTESNKDYLKFATVSDTAKSPYGLWTCSACTETGKPSSTCRALKFAIPTPTDKTNPYNIYLDVSESGGMISIDEMRK